jgi:hypothetical protein
MKNRHIIFIFILIQFAFILLLRAEFLTDWDSYLYTTGALQFQPIGLAGGRWFFTALLGGLWQTVNLFHTVSPDSAWIVFSAATVAFALVNVALFFNLAKRLAGDEAAIVATAIFISSPLTGLYGSAVMTETCALTLLLASCLIPLKPSPGLWHSLLAGLTFALAVCIREPLVLLMILPLGLLWGGMPSRTRAGMVASRGLNLFIFLLSFLVVLLLHLFLTQHFAANWETISKSWSLGMTRERLQMVGWLPKMVVVNFFCLVCWLGVFSPIVLLTLPEQIKVFRTKLTFWMVPLFAAIGLYCLGQIANHSLVFNPRFALFPGALLCIPAALGLWQWLPEKLKNPWLTGTILIILHLSAITCLGSVFQGYYFNKSIAARETFNSLSYAPPQALFIPGRLTPVVEFYKNLHPHDWNMIYAGWNFSDKELFTQIELAREAGRKVYLVEPEYWAEKYLRPDQYNALETVWDRYPHRPSAIAHFSELLLPPVQTPKEFIRQFLNFLFS